MAYTTYITTASQLMVTAAYPAYPDGSYHRGMDTKVPGDTNRVLRAPTNAIIVRSEYGTGGNWSWGNFICGYNSSEGYTWLVAHLQNRLVVVGDTVNAGDVIGYYDSTGNVTGPHAHWEKHIGNGITNDLAEPDFVGVPNAIGTYDVEYGAPNPPDPPIPPAGRTDIFTLASGIIPIITQLQSQGQLKQMIDATYLTWGKG